VVVMLMMMMIYDDDGTPFIDSYNVWIIFFRKLSQLLLSVEELRSK